MVLKNSSGAPITCTDWDDLVDEDGFLALGRNRYHCSYVIYTDGTYYYAENGTTGNLDFGGPNNIGCSGTNANLVIQNAHDALPSSKGMIFIRRGTYPNINITMSPQVWFYGEGMEVTILTGVDDTDVFDVNKGGVSTVGGGILDMSIKPEGTCNGIDIDLTYNFQIENVRIVPKTTSYTTGINLGNGTHIATITNCFLLDFTSVGIDSHTNANGAYIEGTNFYGADGSIGLDIAGSGWGVDGNYFEVAAPRGWNPIKVTGLENRIIANKIHPGYTLTSIGIHVTGVGAYGTLIEGNSIWNNDGGGYGIYDDSTSDFGMTTIADNYIWHNGINGIYIASTFATITGNQIPCDTDATGHAIVITTYRNRVTDNYIYSADISLLAINGINLQGAIEYCQINDNLVRYMANGIVITGANHHVHDNQIFDCTASVAVAGTGHDIQNNRGYNPLAASLPAVGGSPVVFGPYVYPMMIGVVGGTITSVTIRAQATGQAGAGTFAYYSLYPGDTCTIVYTIVPVIYLYPQ